VTEGLETRQRLLEVATQLFARRGFNDVTVREICHAAQANVAAVNYHFHDKFGLYSAVVGVAIDAIRGTSEIAREQGAGESAEQQLRIFTRVFLGRIMAHERDSWIHQLISREMSEPTPAFDLIIKQAIRPRIEYLANVVRELLDCPASDPRVTRCVASVHSQFLFWLNPAVTRVFPRLSLTAPTLDELSDHIAEFSLAGIRAIARQQSAVPVPVARGRRRPIGS
jgi:AcrR family transcriptional regulator